MLLIYNLYNNKVGAKRVQCMWRGVIFIGCRIVKHPMTHTSGILPRISSTRTRVRSDLIQTATDPERS
eukprot:9134796-Pyramimonas_sp.AAC.1